MLAAWGEEDDQALLAAGLAGGGGGGKGPRAGRRPRPQFHRPKEACAWTRGLVEARPGAVAALQERQLRPRRRQQQAEPEAAAQVAAQAVPAQAAAGTPAPAAAQAVLVPDTAGGWTLVQPASAAAAMPAAPAVTPLQLLPQLPQPPAPPGAAGPHAPAQRAAVAWHKPLPAAVRKHLLKAGGVDASGAGDALAPRALPPVGAPDPGATVDPGTFSQDQYRELHRLIGQHAQLLAQVGLRREEGNEACCGC